MAFGFDDDYEVAIASAAFSLVSILVTILAVKTQRNVFRNRESVLVEFTVHGLTAHYRHLQTRTKAIAKGIADLLKLHDQLVEIEQPRGFGFRVNLYINDVLKRGNDYKAVLENAICRGTLAVIIRNHWELDKEPMIKDFKYTEIQSDVQQRNTAQLRQLAATVASHSGTHTETAGNSQPEIVYSDAVPKKAENDVEMTSIPNVLANMLSHPSDGQQKAGCNTVMEQ